MKWAVREAVDVYFKAKSPMRLGARMIRAGEPVLIFDTVQTSALEVEAEISYVTGGRGNSRILSFEGDKTLTFNFEDALLSNEGLAILSGADLIPARNPHLPGASPDARHVITHFVETRPISVNNLPDADTTNQFPFDESLRPPGAGGDFSPRGNRLNVWLSQKPFVGQNASVYVALLDSAGNMSGAPIEINLHRPNAAIFTANGDLNIVEMDRLYRHSFLATFSRGDSFIAVDVSGNPIPVWWDGSHEYGIAHPCSRDTNAIFDDQVVHYVDVGSMARNWISSWGPIQNYIRAISAAEYGDYWGHVGLNRYQVPYIRDHEGRFVRDPATLNTIAPTDISWDNDFTLPTIGTYSYLLPPSGGGVGHPKAFRENGEYVYKANVPSLLFQDIVHLDYYVAHRRHATQVSILPDKFGQYMYVEGSTLVRRASDGKDLPAHFVIPKFKVTTALTFTMAPTGDPGAFNFQGDAYQDFSKFDLTRRVLADIQIIEGSDVLLAGDPTDYRRFEAINGGDEYLWKDPSIQQHGNIDYADTRTYDPSHGGPSTWTPGKGLISRAAIGELPGPPDSQSQISMLRIAEGTTFEEAEEGIAIDAPSWNPYALNSRIEASATANFVRLEVETLVANTRVTLRGQQTMTTGFDRVVVFNPIPVPPGGAETTYRIDILAPDAELRTYNITVGRPNEAVQRAWLENLVITHPDNPGVNLISNFTPGATEGEFDVQLALIDTALEVTTYPGPGMQVTINDVPGRENLVEFPPTDPFDFDIRVFQVPNEGLQPATFTINVTRWGA